MSKEMEIAEIPTITDDQLTMHLSNIGLLKDLTDGEKNTYLAICHAFNLNPFKREVHVSKYNGVMTIITGYETYIKRAERSGQLDGWGVTTSGTVEAGDLKATVTIHRKDRSHPFIWEALYTEYVQKTGAGVVTKFWQKATTMIKKVAISQAFRLCFSDELGGMPYTTEEVQTDDISHEVMPEEKARPKRAATPVKVKPVFAYTDADKIELKNLVFTSTLTPERKSAALIAIEDCTTLQKAQDIKLHLLKVQPNESTINA